MSKYWMIISWKHEDHMNTAYGKLIYEVFGTREDAEEHAREFIPEFSPVGIVEEVIIRGRERGYDN